MAEFGDTDGFPPEHRIRLARADEIASVARILGSAFTNDPIFTWMCPQKPLAGTLFNMEAMDLYRHHDHMFINESHTGAALWLPPGVSARSPFSFRTIKFLAELIYHGGMAGLQRGGMVDEAMSGQHPQEPHYYLHAIGAHLDHQGQGIGSALLKAGVAICDREQTAAYLESSNIRNNPLYERYGFEVTGEINIPNGGPTAWLMKRPAP